MGSSEDTIAAIATAPGEGAISIVRLSGPDSLRIADGCFRCAGLKPSERSGNSFVRGFVASDKEDGGSDIDEAVLMIYRAPHSYTREDVVEIQGHGGAISARRILRTLLDAGARLGEPGEFTRRAFLSGRIDLLQAEAVADLIRARTDRAAESAVEQLEGGLSDLFGTLYDRLLSVAGDLEGALDFEDIDFPTEQVAGKKAELEGILDDLQEATKSWDEGHLLREGALVVISGPPNVGKSTLLNALLGKSRAIVAEQPGTTRDTIEEGLVLNGFPVRLADTAGLRATDCTIEQEGIERANEYIERAHLELCVLDASSPLDESLEVFDRLPERTVLVLNKTDLGSVLSPAQFPGHTAIPCSLVAGDGLDGIRSAIIEKLNLQPMSPPHATVSERHRAILLKAHDSTREALGLLLGRDSEAELVMIVSCLRDAIYALGTATGRTYETEILDRIFSEFCIGK